MTPPWPTLIAYAFCVAVAAMTVPSWQVFLTYGVATWFGGALFAMLWPWLVTLFDRD